MVSIRKSFVEQYLETPLESLGQMAGFIALARQVNVMGPRWAKRMAGLTGKSLSTIPLP